MAVFIYPETLTDTDAKNINDGDSLLLSIELCYLEDKLFNQTYVVCNKTKQTKLRPLLLRYPGSRNLSFFTICTM